MDFVVTPRLNAKLVQKNLMSILFKNMQEMMNKMIRL